MSIKAVDYLWKESINYPYPTPFSLYLDLIGWNEARHGGKLAQEVSIGVYEARLVGDALIEYADDPQTVWNFITSTLDGNQLTIDYDA